MKRRERPETIEFPTPIHGQKLSLRQGIARQTRLWRQRLRVGSDNEYNERIVYAEVVFQAIAGAGALSFVTVFLVRLGAPSWLVGLYTSVPALVVMLAVLPMGAWVQRRSSLVRTVNRTRLVFRSFIASFAALPFLPPSIAPYVLVATRSLASVPGAALDVSVTTLWGRVTSPSRRPRMLSTRLALHGIVAAGVGLLVGQWLERARYPLNYQLLFLTAGLAAVGSALVLSRLRVRDTDPKPSVGHRRSGIKEMLTLVRDTPEFRNFAIAALVFRLGMTMPAALFDIYRVRVLGSSDAWIGALLTVERVVSVFAYFAVAAIATRPKAKSLLWLTCVGVALYPLTTAAALTPAMLIIPGLVAGLFAPGMNVFLTDTLFQVSPEDQRATFIAANTFLANLIAFAGPLLGTAISGLVGIRTALLIAAVLRAAGALVFWRLGVGGSRPARTQAAPTT